MAIEISTLAGRIFRILTCFRCGVEFGMLRELDETCLRDKQEFFCSNGHGQHYTTSLRETVTRLRTDLSEAIAARDTAEREHRDLLSRVENGTCRPNEHVKMSISFATQRKDG